MKITAFIVVVVLLAMIACDDSKAATHRRAKDIASSFRYNWQIYQQDDSMKKLTVREFVKSVEGEALRFGRYDRGDFEVSVIPSSILECALDGTNRSADAFTIVVRIESAKATAELEFKPQTVKDRPSDH